MGLQTERREYASLGRVRIKSCYVDWPQEKIILKGFLNDFN